MNNIWTILKRELGAYFNSAIAYIYLIVFIAINNGLFMTRFFLIGKADMRSFFDTLPMTLFVFIPVLTMRLWAEDKKENTFELLMTFPMKPAELVLGKFFAGLIFYAVSLISTMTLPIVLAMAGRPDIGAIMGGYAGALLMGALFLAIGIFISGFTKEQIVAFVLAILGCFIIYLLGSDFLASFFDGWFSGLGSFMKNYLGAVSHSLSFNKGVIDIKDIVYFAVMVFVPLFLNGLFFEGRMRPNAKLVFSSAVCICFVGVIIFNWLVHDLPFGRFDVTENRIYTVSKASRKILTGLKAPVLIRVYITPVEKMPTALKTLEQDITGKLDELKIVSGNKLKYQVAHIEAANLMEQNPKEQKPGLPEAGAETSLEKTLQAKGIVPFQVESIDRDELGVKLVYSALTITYKEKGDEILPRLVPGNIPDMEYLLLSRIVKLTQETKPKIALFSPLKTQELSPEMSQLLSKVEQTVKPQYEDEYANVVPLMRNNGYDVSRIALTKDDPIPAGLNTLLVLNPGVLNDRQVYEINKFIYQGGSALIAAAGFDYSFQISPPMGVEISPRSLSLDINKLTQMWGVKLSDKMLMDENSQIINISTGQNVGPFAVSMPVKIPNQILINDDTMNRNMPYMSRLPSLFYLWGSALEVSDEIIKQSTLKKTLMFTSTDKSWQATSEGGFLKRESLQFPKAGSEGKFPLGVMLEGQFALADAFAQSGPPAWPAKEGEGSAAHSAAPSKELGLLNPKPGKLIIIGCSKMFTDQVLASGGNLTLFANIIDGLTLGNDLIEIRSKTPVSRDIKRASDAQKIIYRFLAIFLMPLLLIVYSSLRIFLRGKEKQFYLLARGQ